ncbi:MAG: dephospho-CoA kinase [Bacteroidia bacterium]|nr:MAG: dephospho-CoA kinase [Bacteroidia bacterium]
MILVGLTGSIGSGKTTVCRIFEQLRIPVYYADARGKSFLTKPVVKTKIASLFGPQVFNDEGEPDRAALAALVFDDAEKLEMLNSIIHPLVREDFRNWAGLHKDAEYVIQEAAILFETGHADHFDKIITVTAPEELRIRRVCERDGVDEAHVRKRAAHQLPDGYKTKHADYVICNDGVEPLLPQVLKIHEELKPPLKNDQNAL